MRFYKKNLGAPSKITPFFLDFSKKSATQKTRFFPVGRNFGHRFLKKGPKSSIFGVPDLENFFRQTFDKKTPTHQKFGRDPTPRHFNPFFRKSAVEIFIFFLRISREITAKFCSFSKKYRLFTGFLGKLQQKSVKKNLHDAFSKKGVKMSRGRVPTEFFGVSDFFYRKFVEKTFRGRGPQKSTILGLFSKIDVRNFCQLGKNVFFVLPFFLKNRENGGLFWGVRPNLFSTKLD